MKHIVLWFFVLVTAAGYASPKTGISEAEAKRIMIDYHSERIRRVETISVSRDQNDCKN